jgi:predicted nucleic acid-binding Zn ribbon protein
MELRTCEVCGTAFTPGHPRGRFCSGKCRSTAWWARRFKDPEQERRVRELVRLLAREVGLRLEDLT